MTTAAIQERMATLEKEMSQQQEILRRSAAENSQAQAQLYALQGALQDCHYWLGQFTEPLTCADTETNQGWQTDTNQEWHTNGPLEPFTRALPELSEDA